MAHLAHRNRPSFTMRFSFGTLRILNDKKLNAEPSSPATGDIAAELKRRIQMLYVAHISEGGVDYNMMKASPEFAAYVEETTRLPQLDVVTALPDDAHKIAFFVNLYNALTQHAIVVMGPPPRTAAGRLFYGTSVGYQVGPYRLSLTDIEHGILRRNRSISMVPKPFGKKDPRKVLRVQNVDPRIHFVLNCAASSCPPVLFLTSENLENSLRTATKGFLSNDDNFKIEGNTILLSRILDWYRKDFCANGNDEVLLDFVVRHGDPEQQKVQQLQDMLNDRYSQASVSWLPYDWSLNSAS